MVYLGYMSGAEKLADDFGGHILYNTATAKAGVQTVGLHKGGYRETGGILIKITNFQ